MKWEEIDSWKKSTKKIFTVGGNVVGWIKKYENLAFVTVYEAGKQLGIC